VDSYQVLVQDVTSDGVHTPEFVVKLDICEMCTKTPSGVIDGIGGGNNRIVAIILYLYS